MILIMVNWIFTFAIMHILLGVNSQTIRPKRKQYHIQTDEGPERYFKYETYNGQYRKEKRLDDGTVIGSYAWLDANGVFRQKDYIADSNGYRILKSRHEYMGPLPPETELVYEEPVSTTPRRENVVKVVKITKRPQTIAPQTVTEFPEVTTRPTINEVSIGGPRKPQDYFVNIGNAGQVPGQQLGFAYTAGRDDVSYVTDNSLRTSPVPVYYTNYPDSYHSTYQGDNFGDVTKQPYYDNPIYQNLYNTLEFIDKYGAKRLIYYNQ